MSRPHFLYRQFDAAGRLLYVGITSLPEDRERNHKARSPWGAEIATTTRQEFPNRRAALVAEGLAIFAENPAHNRQRRAPDATINLLDDDAEPLTAQRMTVCITERQKEFILTGVRRYRIGVSEYVRRLFDQAVDEHERAEAEKSGRPQ